MRSNTMSSEKNFNIDLNRLDSYSFERLKDYILKYERYTKQLKQSVTTVSGENAQLKDDFMQLEEHNKDICDVNIDLNNNLMQNEYKRSFLELFEISIKRFIGEMGLRSPELIDEDFASLKEGIKEMKKEIEKNLDYIKNDGLFKGTMKNDGIDKTENVNTDNLKEKVFKTEISEKLADSFKALNSNMNNTSKILSRSIDALKNDYEDLQYSLQEVFYKLAEDHETNSLNKYSLNDLLLISKTKLNSTCNALSHLKKDITKKNSENKVLSKRNESLVSDLSQLQTKNSELTQKLEKFKKNLEIISERKKIGESEITSHIELVKILQEENRKTNLDLQDARAKNLENEKNVFMLRTDKKNLEDRLNDIENKNISLLRQERLKLEQTKRDLELYEDKCRDFEVMLKAENNKYEDLYKKYKELSEDKKVKTKNLDMLKKITNSMDMKDKSMNKSKNNTSISSKLNNSHTLKKSFNGESSKKFIINNEEMDDIKYQLEESNLKVILGDVQLATERKIFAQLITDKDIEITKLNEVS